MSAGPDQVSHMPGFAKVLSDDEIWAAIAYIKSHWPLGLAARQRLLSRRGSHAHRGAASGSRALQ